MTTVTLIGKPNCHLCDDARTTVAAIAAEFDIAVTEESILDDPDLLAEYSEDVPVVLIDGRVHTVWRVDATRFRTALLEAAS